MEFILPHGSNKSSDLILSLKDSHPCTHRLLPNLKIAMLVKYIFVWKGNQLEVQVMGASSVP